MSESTRWRWKRNQSIDLSVNRIEGSRNDFGNWHRPRRSSAGHVAEIVVVEVLVDALVEVAADGRKTSMQ